MLVKNTSRGGGMELYNLGVRIQTRLVAILCDSDKKFVGARKSREWLQYHPYTNYLVAGGN